MRDFLFVAAPAMVELSMVPYLISIFKGVTKPHKVTYFVWTLLGGVAFFASLDLKSYSTIIVTGLVFLNVLIVFLLSIKYGMPGWNAFDILCLFGALFGFLLLFVIHAPLLALIVTVVTDFIAVLPTLRKIHYHPDSDHMQAWLIYSIGAFLNLFLISSFSLEQALYPGYMFAEGILIIGFIMIGKAKQRSKL